MRNRRRSSPPANRRPRPEEDPVPRPAATPAGFPVVGVGASAGGLEAFRQLLQALPPPPGLASVLVQHLDPTHPSALAGVLGRESSMPIVEAREGMAVESGHIYIIPPNTMMEISHRRLHLTPRGRGLSLPIDHFFRTLAADRGAASIGVILSGTASDGVLGLEAIRAEGGITFAQDEGSAGFTGMPHNAVAAGCVDFVMPPAMIASELCRLAGQPWIAGSQPDDAALTDDDPAALVRVHAILRASAGADFREYKPSTVKRRVIRRMALRRLSALKEYADLLAEDSAEQASLVRDLLIPVTSFFRDPQAFQALASRALPMLLKDRNPADPVRVWVPGCSTGEEAYSIAITLLEHLGRRRRESPVMILATDLNDAVLEKARAGVYDPGIAADVSPARLRAYFSRTSHGYEIAKSVRALCVLARHNLVSDTPYSKLDLISCRNVLIYMEPALQKRILPVFHYALRPGGLLLLGASESAAAYPGLFRPVDPRNRIYARREGAATIVRAPGPQAAAGSHRHGSPGLPVAPLGGDPDAVREANRVIANRFSPAGVIVNDNLEIVQFRGQVNPYLNPAPGRASLELLRLVQEGLVHDLRLALSLARKRHAVVRRENVLFRAPEGLRRLALEVIPIRAPGASLTNYFVLFEERRDGRTAAGARGSRVKPGRSGERHAGRLQQELQATRDDLQAVIEQQESTKEELQSAHEEVLSSNEELQSANEELQTAQEEMQSANEELTTLNEEVQSRNQELTIVSQDLANLLESVHIPIVLMDAALRVRRYTPAAGEILQLTPADLGRPIAECRLPLEAPELEKLMREAVDQQEDRTLDVQDRTGHWYSLRLQRYLTPDAGTRGLVLSLLDIDAEKTATVAEHTRFTETEDELTKRETNLRMVLDQVPALVWTTDLNLAITSVFGGRVTGGADGERPPLAELFGGGDEAAPALDAHHRALSGETTIFEYRVGDRTYQARVAPKIRKSTGRLAGTIGAAHDVTEFKLMDQLKNDFISTVSHELRTPVTSIHGALRLLATRRAADLPPETRALVDVAVKNSMVLAKLVGDIVDLQKIESGRMTLSTRPLDLADLARKMVEVNRPYGEEFGVTYVLKPAPPVPPVQGDPDRLGQVVSNLLSNSAKFSPRGSAVEVEVQPKGETVRFSVRNFGPPIPEQYRTRIFEKFGTVDVSDSRLRGGTGLGLSICRSIVERHGGTVDFESDPALGTVFYFELPAAMPED